MEKKDPRDDEFSNLETIFEQYEDYVCDESPKNIAKHPLLLPWIVGASEDVRPLFNSKELLHFLQKELFLLENQIFEKDEDGEVYWNEKANEIAAFIQEKRAEILHIDSIFIEVLDMCFDQYIDKIIQKNSNKEGETL